MILKEECKKIGLSVAQFSEFVDVPESTLRKWAKNRSVLLEQLFIGFQAKRLADEIKHKNNVVFDNEVNRL